MTPTKHLPPVLYSHPFEIAFAVVLLFTGARVLTCNEALPSSIGQLPPPFEAVYRLTVIAAGVLLLAALLCRGRKWSLGVEQGGLWLAGTALATYAVAVLFDGTTPRHTLMVGTLLALSIACALRARSIRKEEQARAFALREAIKGGRDE